jgi:hypothetical protein
MDGVEGDHSITKFDAALYVAKYNRALLRRTIEEAQRRMRQISRESDPTLRPVLSPGFLGLRGTF